MSFCCKIVTDFYKVNKNNFDIVSNIMHIFAKFGPLNKTEMFVFFLYILTIMSH